MALALMFAAVVTGPSALAAPVAEPPVKLSLKPVGQPGAYFALTMNPGESRRLQAELGNHGTAPIEALTYAADAYTIINGGFGAKERGSKPAETTTWLSYPTEVLQLPAGQSSIRDFSLAVPTGTAPGQYLTSLVLENNVPVEGSGSVALNQIIRQVIGVSIKVPGPLQPGFAFGSASHKITADRSVVDIAIENTGNTSLKPAGQLSIQDSSGKTVSQTAVTMGSLYARTATKVETTLDGQLQPGEYTLTISLTDPATKTTAKAVKEPFTVAAKQANDSTESQQVLPQIIQDAGSGPLTYIIATAVLAIITTAVFLLRSRRRRRGRRSARASSEDTTAGRRSTVHSGR